MAKSTTKAVKLKSGNYAIKGEVEWAKVHTPDTKFDENGVYSIDYPVTEEEKDEIEKLLLPLAEEKFEEECKKKPALKKQGKVVSPVKEVFDDEGEVSGYVIKLKQKAKIFSKKHDKWYDMKPRVIDGKGKDLDPSLLIGNGSIVASSFEPSGYFSAKDKEAGVTLRLRQCKVLELVEYGGVDELDEFESDFDSSGMKGSQPEETIEEEFDDAPFSDEDEDGDDIY